jgi:hypothetical protein
MNEDVMKKLRTETRELSSLEVVYRPCSIWYFEDSDPYKTPFLDIEGRLPFQLKDVDDWYVKWDRLFVKHTPESKWVEYYPHISCGDDFEYSKHPEEVFGIETSHGRFNIVCLEGK